MFRTLCLVLLVQFVCSSNINVSMHGRHTAIIRAYGEDEFLGISAKVRGLDGRTIGTKYSDKPELTLHYPGVDLKSGFTVEYILTWRGAGGVYPEEGSFSYNVRDRHPQRLKRSPGHGGHGGFGGRRGHGGFEGREEGPGFGFDPFKFVPKQSPGFFPKGPEFPRPGPPPFWSPGGFPPHNGWDKPHHHHHHHHGLGSDPKKPCSSEEDEWNAGNGSSNGNSNGNKWNGPDNNNLNGNNWQNNWSTSATITQKPKPVVEITTSPLIVPTTPPPTTPSPDSTPLIDIRFGKDN